MLIYQISISYSSIFFCKFFTSKIISRKRSNNIRLLNFKQSYLNLASPRPLAIYFLPFKDLRGTQTWVISSLLLPPQPFARPKSSRKKTSFVILVPFPCKAGLQELAGNNLIKYLGTCPCRYAFSNNK